MKTKRINITVAAEARVSITASRTTIETAFADCRSMTGRERQRLVKLGDGSEAFVSDMLDLAKNNVGLLPRDIDVAVLEQDIETMNYVQATAGQLRQLAERMDHSVMLMGSDVMTTMLSIYGILQKTGDEAGIGEALREIGQRFAKKKAVTDPVTPKPDPAPVAPSEE